ESYMKKSGVQLARHGDRWGSHWTPLPPSPESLIQARMELAITGQMKTDEQLRNVFVMTVPEGGFDWPGYEGLIGYQGGGGNPTIHVGGTPQIYIPEKYVKSAEFQRAVKPYEPGPKPPDGPPK